jgi:hypothetical protein
MDPTATAQSLYTLALSTKKLLDDTKEKESTLISLSDTVSRICAILGPIQNTSNLERSVIDACLSLGEAFSRTREHLVVWEDKQQKAVGRVVTFLVPPQLTKLLKDDEHDLNQQLILVLFSLAMIGFFRGRSSMSGKEGYDFVFGGIGNKEVLSFWRSHLSDKVRIFEFILLVRR